MIIISERNYLGQFDKRAIPLSFTFSVLPSVYDKCNAYVNNKCTDSLLKEIYSNS